jgi:hypothetical protein
MAIPNTTITCPIPANINPLSPNGFMFGINKLPTLKFFCQQVNLPGITLGAPEFGNPFNIAPIPGETLTYDQLTVQFLVSEDMSNYQAIYNWIVALGFPQDYSQYTTFISGADQITTSELAANYSDATLQILGPNNLPVKTVTFYDMFPVGLDSLMFQSTNQDVNYLIGNVTFRYGYYKFTS